MVFGAVIGWIVGILSSPYGPSEEKRFSSLVKAVSVFISGYALAKIDPIITALARPELVLSAVIGFRALAFIVFFFLALIITYVYRQYG